MNNNTNFAEQTETPSLIVGKRVVFSMTKDTLLRGLVLDKCDIKEKSTDDFTVTGYIVQEEASNEFMVVAYWRIKKFCNASEGLLKGGFNRERQSEF